jgi:hypothetical protein
MGLFGFKHEVKKMIPIRRFLTVSRIHGWKPLGHIRIIDPANRLIYQGAFEGFLSLTFKSVIGSRVELQSDIDQSTWTILS